MEATKSPSFIENYVLSQFNLAILSFRVNPDMSEEICHSLLDNPYIRPNLLLQFEIHFLLVQLSPLNLSCALYHWLEAERLYAIVTTRPPIGSDAPLWTLEMEKCGKLLDRVEWSIEGQEQLENEGMDPNQVISSDELGAWYVLFGRTGRAYCSVFETIKRILTNALRMM
ncbi:hypothetical protein AOQ84DRAFT_157196 [Glonium stellatum]|uniref:Uncharacterized protein n=1 Tax=Glonium stellatum TaxID=574774 RepID=A0A8E2EQU3_9PEZI|nr:hypothetical protein AOQ84DRAFT_157196 [Glonium stellatum]